MKNFFNKLVAVLLMVAATVGVSCHDCETYDDTEIREQIADLYSKLAALESKMTTSMEAVQQLISGRTAIETCTQDDKGNWILTLTNGKTITVYAQQSLPTNLVYTMEYEGELVWATMGANGTLTPIYDAEGQTVPVAAEIPSIQLRTNGGVIEISIDGGQTWTATGVSEKAMQDAIAAGTANACLIKGVEQKDGKMIITLQSGDTFEVAMLVEADFGIKSGKLFFVGSETKTIDLEAEGCVDISVLSTPEAWKAKVDGLKLSITAPAAEDLVDSNWDGVADTGVADLDGYVKLLATTEDGKSLIGKIFVSGSEDVTTINIDKENNIIVNNQTRYYFALGMMPAEEFDAEVIAEDLLATRGASLKFKSYNSYNAMYAESEIPAGDLYKELYGEDMPFEKYVVWMAPFTHEYDSNYEPIPAFAIESALDLVYTDFAPICVEATATAASFNDITVKINFQGFERYYGAVVKTSFFNVENSLMEINNAYETGTEGMLTSFRNDAPTIETSLAAFPCSYIDNVQFNTSYTMWIVPVKAGQDSYSENDMYVFEFTSGNLEAGGTLTVTEKEGTLVEDYQKISVELNNNEEAYAIYYQWYETSEMPSDEELAMDVLTTGFVFDPAEPELSLANLTQDTSYTLVVVPLSDDGKYGSVCKFEHKTKGVIFSETFTLQVEQKALPVFEAATAAQFALSTEGATGTSIKYYYLCLKDTEIATWGSDDAIAAELALGAKFKRKTASLTNGAFKVTGLTTGTQYTLFVLAVDGSVFSQMQKYVFTPVQAEVSVVASTDERWAASKPTITIDSVTPPTSSWSSNYSISYTVTPAEGTKVSGGQYINTQISGEPLNKLSYMLTRGSVNFYIKEITEATSYSKSFNPSTLSIYVTWTDADGNYYEPMQVVVPVE